jgi:arylformamidase
MHETAQSPVNALAGQYEAEVMARADALPRDAYAMQTLPYGDDSAQIIEVMAPQDRPVRGVLAFLHGGGFTHGRPAWNRFMAPLAAQAGMALASVGYRLLPLGQDGPMQLDDVAAALAHLQTLGHARIVVGGHSAGAALAAGVALCPDVTAGVPLCGALCLSASLHRPAITGTPGADYTLPAGPLQISPHAPLAWLAHAKVPMMIGWGGQERQRARVERSSMAMITALADRDVPVAWVFDDSADHFQTHLNAADPAHPWFASIAAWLGHAIAD